MNAMCNDIERELASFAADELGPVEAQAVAVHLAACASCRQELAREFELRRTLAGLPLMAAPAAPGTLPGRTRRRLRLPGFAGLVAAALTAALLAVDSVAPPRSAVTPPYPAAQVDAARRDAVRTLVLAARILERSERTAVSDLFGTRLPRTVVESLRGGPATPEGGQG